MAGKPLEGTRELTAQLLELAGTKDQGQTLRAAVRTPMRAVMKRAAVGLARISPGKRGLHRTYKGRLVAAGFALRSLRMITVLSKDKKSASAVLGVRKEAFYVTQFFELGTSKIRAQPWLKPAFSNSKEEMLRGVAEVLKKRVEAIAGRSK